MRAYVNCALKLEFWKELQTPAPTEKNQIRKKKVHVDQDQGWVSQKT